MNKMKKYLLMLAALFVAAISFTACSSEDDLANAEEEQERGVVKAQFNISIPQTTRSTTRTTLERVQFTEDIREFLGIRNIYLLPFKASSSTASIKDETSKGTVMLQQMIKPTGVTMQSNTIPGKKLVGASKSVLFGDVELTIGTNRFLFYGEAIPKDGGNSFLNGSIVVKNGTTTMTAPSATANITPNNLEFSLEQIGKTSGDETKEAAILNYLKLIAQAQDDDNNKWSETNNLDLRILYNNFTGIESGTPHNIQGSSLYLQASIQDLYKTMLARRSNSLANAVCNAIENTSYVTAYPADVKYVSTDPEVQNQTKTVDDVKIPAGTVTFNSALLGYPENLPDGAAMIIYDASNRAFSYVGDHEYSDGATTPTTLDVNSATDPDLAAIGRYVYPASLYYMAESKIKTSTQSQAAEYDGTKSWDDVLSSYDNSEGSDAISSTTRSIALESPVNYAVGRFDVKVAAASDGNATDQLNDAKNNTVNISDLEITGVLVGQQRCVDWNFVAKESSHEYIIYDNVEQSCGHAFPLTTSSFDNITNSYSRSETTVTYTQNYDHVLVFPTRQYVSGTPSSGDDKVKVVLEFRNKGEEFVGKDGIIPHGCKFYLIGELDMTKINDNNKKIDYIFQKDYVTTAKFTVKNLSKAIRSIPDLRNPQIELGLSVDLHWETGNTFPIDIE